MHPFFQKSSIKTNSKPPTPTKSEDATSTTEETRSPGPDSTAYDEGDEDSPISLPASQPGDAQPEDYADDHGSKDETEKIDAGISTDFTVDLNWGRRKQRKFGSSTEPQVLAHGEGKDWLHQLEEAAVDGSEPAPTPISASVLASSASPKTRKSVSKQPASPRRTPRRTRNGTTTDLNSKKSITDGVASPDSAPPMPSPTAKVTPKKKLLKLNANGKLLSSPVIVSPTSKSKGRRGDDKRDEQTKPNIIIVKYGTDQEGRSRIGMRIDDMMNKPSMSQQARLQQNDAPPKATHPFFLGKLGQKLESDVGNGPIDTSNKDQGLAGEDKPSPLYTTVAWKDIVFTSQKPTFTKTLEAIGAPWPPNEIQHLGAEVNEALPSRPLKLRGAATSKSKEQRTQIMTEENFMHNFSNSLHMDAKSPANALQLPHRIVATGQQMLAMLDDNTVSTPDQSRASTTTHAAIGRVRSLLPTSSTAFDQGRAGNGSSWTLQYAPSSASDVLQPTASQLHDWMRSLTTSVTQKTRSSLAGKTAQISKRQSRKKKRRKVSNELDGFIASSDDDSEAEHGSNVKNAVLISGPPGCGKTASVFAVAKELDFEVFEVHPGMRRSAKEIFDKVGDMTQNHLVQGVGNETAAESDPNIIDSESINQDITSGKQGMINKLFSSKTQTGKIRKSPRKINGKPSDNAKALKAQKQSMILLEEVDVLFDEDKGFWSGVMSLISQSKRPIVLTCNDESSIPLDDLPLHTTWRYQPPTLDLASEYLVVLAANEGHLLDRDSVRTLYRSKGYDLRATITELDFWCQMGIGSQKGGLDWMLDRSSTDGQTITNDGSLRVFSKGTYASGIGLALPSQISKDQQHEELLNHAQDYLEIPVTGWQEASDVLHTASPFPKDVESPQKQIDDLQWATELLDSRSVLDLFDDSLTAALSVRIATALTPDRAPLQEADVVRAYFTTSEPSWLTKDDILSAFEPMTVEKPTFPPALGRLAPSFEGPISVIAADIAPYVRSIVAFDQLLKQHRETMTGNLQGNKVRKTRAARAALEGGSKANTRREQWFSVKTDVEKVMQTAGKGWPLWAHNDTPGVTQSQQSTEASSPEIVANEGEH